MFINGFLGFAKGVHNAVMNMTLLGENLNLLGSFLQRVNYLFVGLFLVKFLLLFHGVFFASIGELIFELLNNVQVCICDFLIVLLYLLILLGMLFCQVFN
jgi:hypothetical protein